MSQRELAEPGVSYAYISRIEADARQPSLKAIRLLARKLGVTPEYLETGQWLPEIADRQIRLSDAELELRLGRDLDKARAVFAEAAETENVEPALASRARAGLGLLAAREGDSAAVIGHLEAAVASGYMPPDARPDVWETLGAALSATGAHDRAVDVFERALAQLREPPSDEEDRIGRSALEVRAGAYLANALSALGNVERARQVLDEVAEAAEQSSPEARVFVLWTYARLAWMKYEAHAAMGYMGSAIGVLQATDDALQLARAHLLCAQMETLDARADEGARREAARHLAEAEPLLALGADASDLGVLHAERAKLAALDGDAEATGREAQDAARLLGDDVRFTPLRAYVLGLAAALAGDLDAAQPNFETAVEELGRRQQWREATEAARAWARILRAAGRETEALDVMEEAAVLNARHVGVAHRWRVRQRAE